MERRVIDMFKSFSSKIEKLSDDLYKKNKELRDDSKKLLIQYFRESFPGKYIKHETHYGSVIYMIVEKVEEVPEPFNSTCLIGMSIEYNKHKNAYTNIRFDYPIELEEYTFDRIAEITKEEFIEKYNEVIRLMTNKINDK
jgi:hypothetical protein